MVPNPLSKMETGNRRGAKALSPKARTPSGAGEDREAERGRQGEGGGLASRHKEQLASLAHALERPHRFRFCLRVPVIPSSGVRGGFVSEGVRESLAALLAPFALALNDSRILVLSLTFHGIVFYRVPRHATVFPKPLF